jgi:hypothetical protein
MGGYLLKVVRNRLYTVVADFISSNQKIQCAISAPVKSITFVDIAAAPPVATDTITICLKQTRKSWLLPFAAI